MADVKFIIRTADQTRKAEVEMDRSSVGSDIVQAAVDNWALPTDTDYSLVNVTTGKSLVPSQLLDENFVKPGDILEVQPVLVAGRPVNPLDERRRQDLAKITRLGERSRGRITISDIKGAPLDEAVITLAYKTAPSPRYPHESRDATRIRVVLSSRYPFQEPAIEALDPLYNPNVYTSGRFCLGAKWLPTEGLDLLIARVAKIITFNPEILSDRSPANMEAAQWYNATIAASPDIFPTDRFELEAEVAVKKKLLWSEVKGGDAAAAEDETPAICPSCAAKLRVYDAGTIRCPACEAAFEVSR